MRKTSPSDTVCTMNFTRIFWNRTRFSAVRGWRLTRGNIYNIGKINGIENTDVKIVVFL